MYEYQVMKNGSIEKLIEMLNMNYSFEGWEPLGRPFIDNVTWKLLLRRKDNEDDHDGDTISNEA